MMRHGFCLLLLGLLGLSLTACNKQSAPGTPEAKGSSAGGENKISIAVIPKGTIHEFWKTVHAGAEKAARETGVQVIWKGPLKEDDRDAQIAVVEDFINKGVSGIVVAPLDDTALQAPVTSAMRSKIPVVIFDSGLKGNDFVSFVATDNFKGGQLAGEEMGRLLGGQGKVVVLRYQVGSDSTTARENGFLDAIGHFPGIQVVEKDQYAGVTTESAQQAGENLIARFKQADGSLGFDGIFCATEPTTFGVLRSLQDAGLAGKLKFIGFDSSSKMIDALNAGQLSAFVVQNPMQIGYLGVKTMVDQLQGKPVEKRIDTGATLVTKENLNTPAVNELLHPDLAKWLNQ